MAERKCVYTVILLSVCVQFDLDQKFPLECCQAFFFVSIFFFFPPPPTSLSCSLSRSLSPSPPISTNLPPCMTLFITSDRRGRPDRYSDNMVSDPLLNACSSRSSISLGASLLRRAYWLVSAPDNMF